MSPPSFRLQASDGNLVVYDNRGTNNALWSPGIAGRGVVRAVMQTDGNFVAYNARSQAVWSTGTSRQPGAWLAMQNDANLVLYSAKGQALWSMFSVWPYGNVSISGLPSRLGAAAAPNSDQDPTNGGAAGSASGAGTTAGWSTTTKVLVGAAAVAGLGGAYALWARTGAPGATLNRSGRRAGRP